MRDNISTPEKGRQLHLKGSRDGSKLLRRGGDRSEEGADDASQRVESSPETKKTESTPLTLATTNTKNTPTYTGEIVVKKVLVVIKDKAMSLGSVCRKGHTTRQLQVN